MKLKKNFKTGIGYLKNYLYLPTQMLMQKCGSNMVVVAQLVRAPDCGSGGRRFETDLPPKDLSKTLRSFFLGISLIMNLGEGINLKT